MSDLSYRPVSVRLVVACALVSIAGCASVPSDPWFDRMVGSGHVEPSSEVERLTLARLDELPPDSAVAIEGHRVMAGSPYVAASGRTCRTLSIEGSSARLACREARAVREDVDEEDARPLPWFIAPDVFGAMPTETAATAGEIEGDATRQVAP